MTTHWLYSELLARGYPLIEVDFNLIFARDGNIYSSGGITAGIDLALALVEEDLGREITLRRRPDDGGFSLPPRRAIPDAPAGTWVHWVLWNLPASAHGLPEAVAKQDQLVDGMRQGRNSFRKIGYNGPCPPPGKPHRYFFRLYALDEKLELAPGASSSDLQAAMKGHVLGQAEYMGTYRR